MRVSDGKTAEVYILYRLHTGESELVGVKGQVLGANALMTEKLLPTRRLFDEIHKDSVVLQRDTAVSSHKVGQERSVNNMKACFTSFKLLHKNKQMCSVFPDCTKSHNTPFIEAFIFKHEKLNIHNLTKYLKTFPFLTCGEHTQIRVNIRLNKVVSWLYFNICTK